MEKAVMNLDSTCRTCTKNCADKDISFTRILHNSNIQISCKEILSSVFSFSVDEKDGLPQKICQKCCSKLSSAYKLKILVENSHRQLYSYFSKGKVEDEVKEEVKLEIKCEVEESPLKEEGEPWEAPSGRLDGSSDYDDEDDNIPLVLVNGIREKSSPSEMPKLELNDSWKVLEDIKAKPHKKKLRKKRKEKEKGGPTYWQKSRSMCEVCGKDVWDVRAHMATHGGERKRIACGDCPRAFICRSSLKRHRDVNHLGKLFYCQICNKNYKSGAEHRRIKHSGKVHNYACLLCDKKYLSPAQLAAHMLTHTAERAFPCDTCGKCFQSKALSETHRRRVHDKERKNICQFCSKGFFSLHHLSVHLRIHTKEKNYKCEECGKYFGTSSCLLKHTRRHAGIKTVPCTICHKFFLDRGALRTHMISHTKEKKHPCKYCGIMFGRTDHRNRHQRTAHEVKGAAGAVQPAN